MPTSTRTTQKQPQREPGRPARLTSGRQALTSHVPSPTGPHTELLQLQRTAGNQAISQIIQAKLREDQRSNTSEQDVKQQLAAGSLTSSSGGRPLPEAVRQKMETAFGQDFSKVRIHEGQQASSIGAIAYTKGTDIHFAPGTYQPESIAGQALLGHELTHVVQQRMGQVQSTQRNGVALNTDSRLENEAERVSAKVSEGHTVDIGRANTPMHTTSTKAPIQMMGLLDRLQRLRRRRQPVQQLTQAEKIEKGLYFSGLKGKTPRRQLSFHDKPNELDEKMLERERLLFRQGFVPTKLTREIQELFDQGVRPNVVPYREYRGE